jgi:hypothetical protein
MHRHNNRGLYIGKYSPPPPGRGKISANVIWGKNIKSGREKEGKCKGKGSKGKKKEEGGKNKIKGEEKR